MMYAAICSPFLLYHYTFMTIVECHVNYLLDCSSARKECSMHVAGQLWAWHSGNQIVHLEVGDRGLQVGRPVDHVAAAVDQPLLIQPHKRLPHCRCIPPQNPSAVTHGFQFPACPINFSAVEDLQEFLLYTLVVLESVHRRSRDRAPPRLPAPSPGTAARMQLAAGLS